jgi:hypothetical protein
MANEEHLTIIKQGVSSWNAWRRAHPLITPDLFRADLRRADLREAKLGDADLIKADLREAHLINADLKRANLREANLGAADLRGADLTRADLNWADLGNAGLTNARLLWANLSEANLVEVDLSRAALGWTIFGNIDLSTVKGLESIFHMGPSTVGIDTLYASQGKIPETFLRGAGVPEEFITQIPALIASLKPIQFQSCFISYSHRDEEFARGLHSAMRSRNLRVWYAAEEMKGGKKVHEQIFHAIQVHDRLLLVLSTESMQSDWVVTEIKRAKKVEREEKRRKLFPIRLVNFETIEEWECFDADSGKDLAAELREYYIPDFSNWKDHDAFEAEFAKLLRDLKPTRD